MNIYNPLIWKTLLFVFICLASNLNAQFTETSFEEGPIYKKKIDKTFFSDFIGENANGIYAIRLDSKYKENQSYASRGFKRDAKYNRRSMSYESDLYVAKYNKDLSLSKIYPLNYEGKLESIFMLDEKIIVITSEAEEGASSVELFGHILDENDFTLRRRKKLTNLRLKTPMNIFGKPSRGPKKARYRLSVMEEEQMFVIYKNVQESKAGRFLTLAMVTNENGLAFDTNLRMVKEEQGFMESTYSFNAVYDVNDHRKKYNPNDLVEYELKILDNEDYNKFESYTIELERHLVPSRIHIYEMDKKLYISSYTRADDPTFAFGYGMALFADDETYAYSGVFVACFDLEKETFDYAEYHPFSSSFLTKVMTEKGLKKLRKKGLGIADLRPIDVVEKKDGGCYMIAEIQYRKETTKSQLKENGPSEYNYFYKDIIVTSVSADGELEWMRDIDKNQKLKEDNWHFGSFWGVYSNDNLYFVYNDIENNKRIESGEKAKEMNATTKPILVQTQLSPEGKVKKTILSRNPDVYKISSKVRTQLNKENSVILFSKKGTNRRLVRVKFGE